VNEIERVIALRDAKPAVTLFRDGNRTWEEIAKSKAANPLSLSPRQLSRVYEGPDRYQFDFLLLRKKRPPRRET
jgi:hypothetical protein